MQNLKNTKLLTPIELKLWFTSFFVLLLGFLPLIFKGNLFSFEEYCFSGLEMMICRYYDYIPRVKFIDAKQ